MCIAKMKEKVVHKMCLYLCKRSGEEKEVHKLRRQQIAMEQSKPQEDWFVPVTTHIKGLADDA